ncbi:hypothetical protein ACQP06_18280 [Nocardia sp. CA-136227]|uniref:hypothetical protein n=1 Tax=Nocardia sp. CA-136227 TaxID=3239979 RepID=UPI003D97639C
MSFVWPALLGWLAAALLPPPRTPARNDGPVNEINRIPSSFGNGKINDDPRHTVAHRH